MPKILSIHSYRGGTGKSNTTANIAALLAARGMTVGIVDTDIYSPGVHVLFGLEEDEAAFALNDYLWGRCNIEDAAIDVTSRLRTPVTGTIYLIPSSVKTGEIAKILREGYDVGLLNDGFHRLIEELELDALLIDTHPGLNEETLLSIAISDALAVILRPDQQDYQGTGVTVEVARKLDVPRLLLVMNKVPSSLDAARVKSQVEQTYDAEVAAVLPHSDEMMTLASSEVFVLRYPNHPVTAAYRQLASRLMQ
ncbi:MAG: hypothetical protein RLZZ387_184 [Chloroflexota bacterium]|jgi:MinD-like ATPase involved in chromosome partitioning or flagellar assembly